MDNQEYKEATQERITNSYEVEYMVETLLLAERSRHLTTTGIVTGLLKVAVRYAGITDEESRNMFLALAAEISEADCKCSECIVARTAARARVKENWDLDIPEEFPATVGNA
jgi:hypothetical protein